MYVLIVAAAINATAITGPSPVIIGPFRTGTDATEYAIEHHEDPAWTVTSLVQPTFALKGVATCR